MSTVDSFRRNASFFAVMCAIALTAVALVVATVSLLVKM